MEAGLQRRAGRGSVWNLGDALRGSRHGVRLPQVHRRSGTVPRSRLTAVGQFAVSGRAGSEETPLVSAASSPSSGDASAAEANPVEGRACGSDQPAFRVKSELGERHAWLPSRCPTPTALYALSGWGSHGAMIRPHRNER